MVPSYFSKGVELHTLGVDIVEIYRIEKALRRWGERFLNRVYTERELVFYRDRVADLAVHFAGKEAVMKVLGTGNRGVAWREIEILPMRSGKPLVHLYGRAHARTRKLGLREITISLSHSREYAVASALGVGDE